MDLKTILILISSLYCIVVKPVEGVTGPGRNVELGELPWQVLILHDNTKFKCGGALLDEYTVITAAHCLFNKYTNQRFPVDGIFVFAGGINEYSGDGRKAINTTYPEKYVNHGGIYDIALIRVAVPFDFGPEIGAIPLARYTGFQLPIGSSCSVSGFGYTAENGGTAHLRQANVEIRDAAICDAEFGENFNSTSMLCAGGGNSGTGSCNGDSGGPLVCDKILYGIVSFARETCGTMGLPGTYTSVQSFYDWIFESGAILAG